MNELPTSPDSSSDSSPDQTKPQAKANASHSPLPRQTDAPMRKRNWLIYGLFVVLAILLALHWWNARREITELREEVAQRLRAGESISTETRLMMKSVQDGMKELQAKVNVLEGKQVDAQNQQIALEQLYQDLSRNRDDWALAEIEQVLSIANQQLQLAGNVQGAVIALQNAEARLSLLDRPQFLSIRRAIASDLEKLRAVPQVDLAGIAMRLDNVVDRIENMPLLADAKPALPTTRSEDLQSATQGAEPVSADSGWMSEWLARLEKTWRSWSREMWAEVRQLIRVRNVDASDALLLSPTQAYHVRENLKLRLLSARLALLTRNEAVFRSDLAAAQNIIAKYFDTGADQTKNAQALLKQVQASDLAIELPTLAESLNAVRNYKPQP